MRTDSTLIRESDGKVFRVTTLAHWSDITSADGETDTVKWMGSDRYVSNSKGHAYREQSSPPLTVSEGESIVAGVVVGAVEVAVEALGSILDVFD